MAKVIQMTQVGLQALKDEFDELVNVKRPKLVERLAYARGQGDLAENNDYQSAKEDLEFIDGRISELEEVLENATVVKKNGHNCEISIGTKVTVKYDKGECIFEMVGEWEADPTNKKISPKSPLGQALFGKKVGEKAEVEAPAGKVVYEILAIE